MISVDHSNPEFRTALAFVNQTNRHIFLTGKAGTGKTTFLRYLKESGFKKMAVVAPTGVAAINAGGVTIHSFFQIPPGTFLPSHDSYNDGYDQRIINKHSLLKHLRMSRDKKELLNELELLVIDEVSMMRADLLDAIDAILRYARRQHLAPFGGVQVLYIGDLFQLPPVVRNDEWRLLSEYYRSPFFFDAQVIQEEKPIYLELKRVYRQKDDEFISILNNIRNNECMPQDLETLHRYYQPAFIPDQESHYITLTTHNDQANMINQRELRRLPNRSYSFHAEVSGEFPENSFPAEQELLLKIGAQIMFIKNDKGESRRFFNGKIGTVHEIKEDKLLISFPNEPGLLDLKKETWENIRYTFSKEKDRIEEEELGSFTQYPIRLAWAITIHKSQGLTFDKAVIDVGSAFAAGQVYVALSRLTTLNGLILKSKIYSHCIKTDERVIEFTQRELSPVALQQMLERDQQSFIKLSLLERFGFEKIIVAMREHIEDYDHRKIPDVDLCRQFSQQLLSHLAELQQISEKFQKQLEVILEHCELDQYKELNERVNAACSYFSRELNTRLIEPLGNQIENLKIKKRVTKYLKELKELRRQFEKRKRMFENLRRMVASLRSAEDGEAILASIEELHKPIITSDLVESHKKKEKGESHSISLKMFKEGMSIPDIAAARSMAPVTIEGHLISYISTGDVDVLDLVEETKLQKILSILNDQPVSGSSSIKEQLGENYSYSEIRAALKYKELSTSNS